ncbi:HAD family hydrolase [Marinicauda algicola]|nr:HAD family phosphatase [Marinicauda algicola]
MPIRAILWDLGNTLVDWDPRRLYRKLLPSDAAVEDFLGGVCTLAWHARHDAGVPMAQNRQALIEAHPGKADLILAWQERWDEMFDGPVERMDRLFEETRALGLKQYALSNLPAEKWPPLRAMYPFLDRLDAAVITGEEGVIKPDPAIFEITKARIATAPEETLFIDDRAENIAAGERAGFPGLVFEGEAKLRRDLARLGVKLAPPGGG